MTDLELGLLVGGAIGYAISALVWRYRIYMAMRWFLDEGGAEYIKEKYSEVKQDSDDISNAIKVNIEEHQGTFFLYRDSDNQFVAQGKSMEDFAEMLPRLNVQAINIVNGKSEAAQALLKTGKQDENSVSV